MRGKGPRKGPAHPGKTVPGMRAEGAADFRTLGRKVDPEKMGAKSAVGKAGWTTPKTNASPEPVGEACGVEDAITSVGDGLGGRRRPRE